MYDAPQIRHLQYGPLFPYQYRNDPEVETAGHGRVLLHRVESRGMGEKYGHLMVSIVVRDPSFGVGYTKRKRPETEGAVSLFEVSLGIVENTKRGWRLHHTYTDTHIRAVQTEVELTRASLPPQTLRVSAETEDLDLLAVAILRTAPLEGILRQRRLAIRRKLLHDRRSALVVLWLESHKNYLSKYKPAFEKDLAKTDEAILRVDQQTEPLWCQAEIAHATKTFGWMHSKSWRDCLDYRI